MSEHTPAPTLSRGVYGFALYLTCICCFVLYIIWATVPDSILHYMGISYYPQVRIATIVNFVWLVFWVLKNILLFQKYWAVALPVYSLMALALFAFFVYPSLNLLLTPPLDSMTTITDSYANYKSGNQLTYGVLQSGAREASVHGVPPASDIHISKVCKLLYASRWQKKLLGFKKFVRK